jgi:ADP-ribose pyrophosphatase YjhB (NUDIX family)
MITPEKREFMEVYKTLNALAMPSYRLINSNVYRRKRRRKIMDTLDCQTIISDRKFRFRAGAIIIEDECVLLAKQDKYPYMYSIGGGVHINESASDAVVREVKEETGIDYKINRLVYITETFVDKADDKQHRLSFYFLMKSKGNKDLKTNNHEEKLFWIPIENLDDYEISPNWFKRELQNVTKEIKYFVVDQ